MPVLLEHTGIDDPSKQLFHNAILNVLQLLVSVCGAFCTDIFGRRPVLIIGTSIFVIWWAIITGLMSTLPLEQLEEEAGAAVKHGSKAAMAMIYLFGLTYSFVYTPLQALYPVECLSYETRAKGMGVNNLFVNLAVVFNSYGISIIVEKIQWKFYWVYVIWNMFQVGWIYYL